MATRIFWALIAIDTLAMAVLAYLASRGPSSPEGPVGAWLAFIPPIVIVGLVALVLVTGSDNAKVAGICVLGFPWIFVVIGPIYSAAQSHMTDRRLAGDNDFRGLARELAHAISSRDAALVKSLIPHVGDINKEHGENTFLFFALSNAPDPVQPDSPTPAATIEIVQALLDAGAKPDRLVAGHQWPLLSAIYAGPELTEMVLRAGANPNRMDGADRPFWWSVLSSDTDRGLKTLEVLLNHGADVNLRDREGGPAAWAAYHARMSHASSWRAVWMLVERGAAWKGEQEFGDPVGAMLAREFESRAAGGPPVSEEMHKLQARYAEQ